MNNRITIVTFGVFYGGSGTGKYRDNLPSSADTPFSGGTNAGHNT